MVGRGKGRVGMGVHYNLITDRAPVFIARLSFVATWAPSFSPTGDWGPYGALGSLSPAGMLYDM